MFWVILFSIICILLIAFALGSFLEGEIKFGIILLLISLGIGFYIKTSSDEIEYTTQDTIYNIDLENNKITTVLSNGKYRSEYFLIPILHDDNTVTFSKVLKTNVVLKYELYEKPKLIETYKFRKSDSWLFESQTISEGSCIKMVLILPKETKLE